MSTQHKVEHYVSWHDFDVAAQALARRIKRRPGEIIYAIPRGGLTLAARLSYLLSLGGDTVPVVVLDPHVAGELPVLPSLPNHSAILVDDILDSGATVARVLGALRQAEHVQVVTWLRSPVAKPLSNGEHITFLHHADTDGSWVVFPWEETLPTSRSREAKGAAEEAVRTLIRFAGDDPDREGVRETPNRVVRAYAELFQGYSQDPKEILATSFAGEGYDEIVLSRNIEFCSTCEHHMLPFLGHATVGYIPSKKVVGLSKLARLVDVFARRLQIQERMTQQIAQALAEGAETEDVGVVITATHQCMSCRGVRKQNSEMVTSAMLGRFRKDGLSRAEFFSLAHSR